MRKALAPVVLLLLGSMCAFGDIAFSLTNTPVVTPPGGIFDPADCQSGSLACVLFAGEVDPDPVNDIFITGIQLNFTSAPIADPQDFLTNNPLFFASSGPAFLPSVADSGTPFIGNIFEVDVLPVSISDPVTPFGVYQGTATLLGGTDPSQSNPLASANFEIDVVPEPATFGFAALAVAMLAWRLRARHRLY